MTETAGQAHNGTHSGEVAGRRGRRSVPVLKIVLDTNQLYTGSASDLLQQSLRQVIEDSRRHNDIDIQWYIPEIVRWEREYQMIEAACGYLPTLEKLERLLGHSLGFSSDILASRVREAIETQIKDLGLNVLTLAVSEVDWARLVTDAAFRRPPFEKGKREKGFRDALIAECFMQLVHKSPKTPSVCRIALVTGDGILAETMINRTTSNQNIRVVKLLEEIQNLINTLVSNVTEGFVASVRDQVQAYFFSENSKEGLYYTAQVRDKIVRQFAGKLQERPPGAETREQGTWYIGPPGFVEKKRQRVTWRTSIRVEANAYKLVMEEKPHLTAGPGAFPTLSSLLRVGSGSVVPPSLPGISDLGTERLSAFNVGSGVTQTTSGEIGNLFVSSLPMIPKVEQILVAKGHSVFHVKWSVIITTNKKLLKPRVEEIIFVETVWQ